MGKAGWKGRKRRSKRLRKKTRIGGLGWRSRNRRGK